MPPNPHLSPSTQQLGCWSAIAATVCALTYDVAQLAEWAGWLGSRGGPESSSTPLGLYVLLTPSLLLGPAFLVMMVCVHRRAAPGWRAWSHAAVAFATIYAALTGIVYFVQLTLVAPRLAQGRVAGIEPLLFVPFDSVLYAVDILGYTFMCVAMLFAARSFEGGGIERSVRRWFSATGLLFPFLALQMYVHGLIWIASLWAITFPAATISLAVLFRRDAPSAAYSPTKR